MPEQWGTNLSNLIAPSITLWLAVWAYRSRYELDEKMDTPTNRLRWSIVTASYAVAAIPLSFSAMKFIKPSFGILGLAFLVSPNFAFRTRRYFLTKRHDSQPESVMDRNGPVQSRMTPSETDKH
jgi:hypothetical protein